MHPRLSDIFIRKQLLTRLKSVHLDETPYIFESLLLCLEYLNFTTLLSSVKYLNYLDLDKPLYKMIF